MNQAKFIYTRAEVEATLTKLVQDWDSRTTFNSSTKFTTFLDSLDTVEIVMSVEDEYSIEIPDEDAEKLNSIDDYMKYLSTRYRDNRLVCEPLTLDNVDPKST